MNWWMLAGSTMALVCALGHAVAGVDMYLRPMRAALDNDRLAGVVTGMWHLITINFSGHRRIVECQLTVKIAVAGDAVCVRGLCCSEQRGDQHRRLRKATSHRHRPAASSRRES